MNQRTNKANISSAVNISHKKELLDFKLSTFYFFFQTEQFRNSLVTHRWIDMNCHDMKCQYSHVKTHSE